MHSHSIKSIKAELLRDEPASIDDPLAIGIFNHNLNNFHANETKFNTAIAEEILKIFRDYHTLREIYNGNLWNTQRSTIWRKRMVNYGNVKVGKFSLLHFSELSKKYLVILKSSHYSARARGQIYPRQFIVQEWTSRKIFPECQVGILHHKLETSKNLVQEFASAHQNLGNRSSVTVALYDEFWNRNR